MTMKKPFALPSLVDLTEDSKDRRVDPPKQPELPKRGYQKEPSVQTPPKRETPTETASRVQVTLLIENDDLTYIEEQRAKERKYTHSPTTRTALLRAFATAVRQSHYHFADKSEEELCEILTKKLLT
jgi:hypothetical protein